MDNLMKYTFSNLYEHIDSSIEKYPFFLNGHGNMFIVRDETIPVCEPNEEKRKFYCKPVTSDCTAIVLVADQSNQTKYPISPSIAEKINILESNRQNMAAVDITKRPRLKEKGIVIKVKKNQEDNKNETSNGLTDETSSNSVNIKKSEENKNQFNPDDYVMETEEDFGPLI